MSLEISQQELKSTLVEYNSIVSRVLRNSVLHNGHVDLVLWDINYAAANSEIMNIILRNEDFFEQPQELIQNKDILRDQNFLLVLVYSAIKDHWYSLSSEILFPRNRFLTERGYDKFQIEIISTNLSILSDENCLDFLSDEQFPFELKSLTRTLVLYFYTRARGKAMLLYFDWLISSDLLNLVRVSIIKFPLQNIALKSTYLYLPSTRVCLELFRNVFDSEDNLEEKIEEVFCHVSNNSYYAILPQNLYGITAIGKNIYLTEKFMHFHPSDWKNAGTLVILIHETAHLASRFYKSQSAYFKQTPTKFSKYCSHISCDGEIGDYIETLLFGEKLKGLCERSGEFILNRQNWELSLEEFKEQFLSIERRKIGSNEEVLSLTRGGVNEDYLTIEGSCGTSCLGLPQKLDFSGY